MSDLRLGFFTLQNHISFLSTLLKMHIRGTLKGQRNCLIRSLQLICTIMPLAKGKC